MADPASLEELIAVNSEILALTRAGLPLAPELRRAAAAMPGGVSKIGDRLGKRIEAGDTLGEAIEADDALPPYYSALVRAGEASGRLPIALQGLSEALARAVRLKRTCLLALAYPLLLALAAWGLLLFSAESLLPSYDWITESRTGNPFALTRALLVEALWFTPLVLFVLFVVWIIFPRRVGRVGGPLAAPLGLAKSFPGVGRVLKLTAASTYCRLLSLMLQQRTPLPVALELAAEATGWPAFDEPSKQIAKALRDGSDLRSTLDAQKCLPPLVRPALAMEGDAGILSEAIAQAASTYDERASLAADTTATLLPVLTAAVLGGGTVAIYAVAMLLPYIQSLKELSGCF